MSRAERGSDLVAELLANPEGFHDGLVNELQKAYFDGYPLATLRPLLRHGDPAVARVAVMVASELGSAARPITADVLPLVSCGDRVSEYYAMEVIITCCDGPESAAEVARVALKLDDQDAALRRLAMRLLSRAELVQLGAAQRQLARSGARHERHATGLHVLAMGENVEPGTVAKMLHADEPLVRRYGAIAAKRVSRRFPILAQQAAGLEDDDVQRFWRSVADE